MRIKIVVDIGDGLTLPVNYNYPLAGVIYRFLTESNPEYASFLHEEGYPAAEKRFKLFTFSQLMAERRRITGDKNPFPFSFNVVRLVPSRTILIPFCGYAVDRGAVISGWAPVTNHRCHNTACAPLSIRNAFPVSLPDCNDHHTRAGWQTSNALLHARRSGAFRTHPPKPNPQTRSNPRSGSP